MAFFLPMWVLGGELGGCVQGARNRLTRLVGRTRLTQFLTDAVVYTHDAGLYSTSYRLIEKASEHEGSIALSADRHARLLFTECTRIRNA